MIPLNRKNQGRTPRLHTRSGATLVELLVVMAIITALGALALMIMPTVANSDNTLKSTADVQGTLKIAQSMAGVSRAPRGVRFIVNPAAGPNLCTEMQYLEAPPVLIPDPQVLVAKTSDPAQTRFGPRVDFIYRPDATGAIPGDGSGRQCIIRGLTSDQAAQVTEGATLVMPTLNAWSRVRSAPVPAPVESGDSTGLNNLDVDLEVFPDAQLGAGTLYRTYHFGIYGRPVPLIGEPTVMLPKGTAVDLNVSSPINLVSGAPTTMSAYDVLFAPSGQLLYTPTNPTLSQNTVVFLWVRDYTKDDKLVQSGFTNRMQPTGGRWAFGGQTQFQIGGEMQIVGIRNGFIGTAPVTWPDAAGNYSGGDPYSDARERLK